MKERPISHLYANPVTKEFLCEKILVKHAEDLKPYTMVWACFDCLCHLNKWLKSFWVKDGKIYYGHGQDLIFTGPEEYRKEHGIVDRYVPDTWELKEIDAGEFQELLKNSSDEHRGFLVQRLREAGASI